MAENEGVDGQINDIKQHQKPHFNGVYVKLAFFIFLRF